MNEHWKNQKRVPRGNPNGGRWTSDLDRIYNNVYESDTKTLPFSLDFFSKKTNTNSFPKIMEIPDTPKEVYGFSKDRLYTSDHMNHSKEMGYKNQPDYNAAAIEFWKEGKGKVYFGQWRKDRFYKYDGEKYVSVGIDGTIHTFMLCTKKRFYGNIIRLEKLYEIQ